MHELRTHTHHTCCYCVDSILFALFTFKSTNTILKIENDHHKHLCSHIHTTIFALKHSHPSTNRINAAESISFLCDIIRKNSYLFVIIHLMSDLLHIQYGNTNNNKNGRTFWFCVLFSSLYEIVCKQRLVHCWNSSFIYSWYVFWCTLLAFNFRNWWVIQHTYRSYMAPIR